MTTEIHKAPSVAHNTGTSGDNATSVARYDLSTSEGGRRYVADFFARDLRRHDFARYITTTLAADFACALAQHLAATGKQQVGTFPWENLPSYLIDKCEGDTISEEGIQRAVADMAKDARYCPPQQVGEVQGDAVHALPSEWRTRAEELSVDDAIGLTHQLKLKDCADELEAALAARQPVRIYGCCAQPEGELHTAECPNMRHLAARQPGAQEEVTDAEVDKAWNRFEAALYAPEGDTPEDRVLSQTIDQRDRYQEVADELADHIARITGTELGEHSSVNCPWQNAIDAAEEYTPAQGIDLGQFRTQVAELLRMEFDLEVADPEDHRHDDGASEAERIASKIAALIDHKAVGNG